MVSFELFRKDQTSLAVEGRFLGLITDKQLALLKKSHEFRRRTTTKPNMLLADIKDLEEKDIKGLRMLMVAKKIEGQHVGPITLFASEKLEYITSSSGSDVALQTLSDSYITVEDVKDA